MKNKFPLAIATSIVRYAQEGEPHGYIYLCNLNNGKTVKKIPWIDDKINFGGRGGDRGLRGISFYNGLVFIAAGIEIIVLDSKLNIIDKIKNEFFKDLHEITIHDNLLYITATKYDAVLVYNIPKKEFTIGYQIIRKDRTRRNKRLQRAYRNYFEKQCLQISMLLQRSIFGILKFYEDVELNSFNPNKSENILALDTIHLNSISVIDEDIYVSGSQIRSLLKISKGKLFPIGLIPKVTHNAQPYQNNKILYNYTANSQVIVGSYKGNILKKYNAPIIKKDRINYKVKNNKIAKPGFLRGFSFINNNYFMVGSSPASIIMFENKHNNPIKVIQLSTDIREAIHGLEIIPESFQFQK